MRKFIAKHWIIVSCLLAVSIVGLVLGSMRLYVLAHSKHKTPTQNASTAAVKAETTIQLDKNAILQMINSERTKVKATNLIGIGMLDTAATNRANDMIVKNEFNMATNAWDFLKQVGYKYSTASYAQSIDVTSNQGLVDSFMGSTQIKGEILSNKYDSIGIGIKERKYNHSLYVVVIYLARPINQTASKSQNPSMYTPTPYTYKPTPITINPPSYSPTANCTLTKSTYTTSYQAAVSAENSRYNTLAGQINSALAYMANHGAANSSAYQQVLAQKAQNYSQHQSTLNSLSSTYQQNIASLNC